MVFKSPVSAIIQSIICCTYIAFLPSLYYSLSRSL